MKTINLITLIVVFALTISITYCQTIAEPPANFTETDAGTVTNPYQIATLANLRWLSETPEVWGSINPVNNYLPRYFIQTADIDASETISWNNGRGFAPIGSSFIQDDFQTNRYFQGNYNGQNHVISDLFIYSHRYSSTGSMSPYLPDHYGAIGMFGFTYRAILKNIRLENATIMKGVGAPYFGLLCGTSMLTIIQNCSVSGSFICSSVQAGGLVGHLNRSVIEYCSAYTYSNNVKGSLVEEICDHSSYQPVSYLLNSVIANSFARGGSSQILYGGLISDVWFASIYNIPVIKNVYVTSSGTELNDNRLGGYIRGAIFTNSFWDTETTEVTEPFAVLTGNYHDITDIYGLTTAEMKNSANYIANGWDFENIWAIDPDINDGYPYLRHDTIAEFLLSETDVTIAPVTSQLLGNYPNPFNPETTIQFSIAKSGIVTLDIFNIKGQLVCSLVNGYYSEGTHNVLWNGKDENGMGVSSGIYFYRLYTGDYTDTKKMLLVK